MNLIFPEKDPKLNMIKSKQRSSKIQYVPGGWSPALRSMALQKMDKILAKPTSLIVTLSFPSFSLETIRDKIAHEEYENVKEWENDIFLLIGYLKQHSNPTVRDIGQEIERKFNKDFILFDKLSNFQFRDLLQDAYQQLDS